MSNKPAYKIVLVGEAGVGKSSIVVRLVHDEFSGREPSTIGGTYLSNPNEKREVCYYLPRNEMRYGLANITITPHFLSCPAFEPLYSQLHL